MAHVIDLARVRSVLERDRPWAAYAIGDLSPAFAPQCEWRIAEHNEALVLAYRGFNPPIAFAMGSDVAISRLLDEVDAPELSLHLKVSTLSALPPVFAPTQVRPMWRMLLAPDRFEASDDSSIDALTGADLDEIAGLYRDGAGRDESPDFFFASMLEQGTFRGIRENGRLVAVAGTHLMAPSLGVCAIGNVYTRRDSRGRGLAGRVTAAVVTHALRCGATTVVLNVRQSNASARRVYERLGFREYCEFVEGSARRVQPYVARA
jgi:ribosomal protein S18 acetylase RimI-like enzyme